VRSRAGGLVILVFIHSEAFWSIIMKLWMAQNLLGKKAFLIDLT
jgi:hypothetical protein